ncbi:hypothetical protein YC2023_090569 [Brassica napus]
MIPSKPEEVVTVDVSQAKTLLQSDHQYLDVRYALLSHHHDYVQVTNSRPRKSSGEAIVWHLRSSTFPTCSAHLKGCQSGARSLNATSELVAAGYKKVRNIGGGYLAWVDQSFPINKEQQQSAN